MLYADFCQAVVLVILRYYDGLLLPPLAEFFNGK